MYNVFDVYTFDVISMNKYNHKMLFPEKNINFGLP